MRPRDWKKLSDCSNIFLGVQPCGGDGKNQQEAPGEGCRGAGSTQGEVGAAISSGAITLCLPCSFQLNRKREEGEGQEAARTPMPGRQAGVTLTGLPASGFSSSVSSQVLQLGWKPAQGLSGLCPQQKQQGQSFARWKKKGDALRGVKACMAGPGFWAGAPVSPPEEKVTKNNWLLSRPAVPTWLFMAGVASTLLASG